MDAYTHRKLLQCGIQEQQIAEMNLSEANLSQQVLNAVDLKGFLVSKINLEYADLSGADLRGMEWASANCVCARFVGADLRGANLAHGYFNNCDFRGADLRGANIANALCSESNFCGADLRGAIFGSEHYNSDFRGADLRGAVVPAGCGFDTLNCDTEGALMTQEKQVDDGNKRKLARIRPIHDLRAYDRNTRQPFGTVVDINQQGMKIATIGENPLEQLYALEVLLPEECTYGRTFKADVRSKWCRLEPHAKWYNTGFKIESISEEDKKIISYLIQECEVHQQWAQKNDTEFAGGIEVSRPGYTQ